MQFTSVCSLAALATTIVAISACGGSDKVTGPGCGGEERSTLAIGGSSSTPDVSTIVIEGRNPTGWAFSWIVNGTLAGGDFISGAFREATDTTQVLENLPAGPSPVTGFLSVGVVGAPNGNVPNTAFFDLFTTGNVELVVHTTAKPDSTVKLRLNPGFADDWQANTFCFPKTGG